MTPGRRTNLGTSEARKALPDLVRQAASRRQPSASLTENAVEIRPRGAQGSASLIPTVDVDAAEARLAALQSERDELEEDLEDAGIALLLQERLAGGTGERLTAAEFLTGIGMEELVARLPRR